MGSQPELFDFPATPRLKVLSQPTAGKGRGDNKLVGASEPEVLWPPSVSHLSELDKVRLFGDIPRNTRLTVKQCCRRLNCDSNTVLRHIDRGDLVAINMAPSSSRRPTYRVYRWSLVDLIWHQIEGGWAATKTQGEGTWKQ